MKTFGAACFETARFDTLVPAELLNSVRDVASEMRSADYYYRHAAPWSKLQEMFNAYSTQPQPIGWRRPYFFSTAAIVARKCGKMDECRAWLKEAGDRLDPWAAKEWKTEADEWMLTVERGQ